jgi:hypothetical protein
MKIPKLLSPPPPNQFNLTLTQKLVSIYKLWHDFLPNFPKDSRYTIGSKIDSLFLEASELIIGGSYSDKIEKLIFLKRASSKIDLLKFFLQVAWEIKSLDNKKYINLSEKLNEAGKMLGGWIKSLK